MVSDHKNLAELPVRMEMQLANPGPRVIDC